MIEYSRNLVAAPVPKTPTVMLTHPNYYFTCSARHLVLVALDDFKPISQGVSIIFVYSNIQIDSSNIIRKLRPVRIDHLTNGCNLRLLDGIPIC